MMSLVALLQKLILKAGFSSLQDEIKASFISFHIILTFFFARDTLHLLPLTIIVLSFASRLQKESIEVVEQEVRLLLLFDSV